MAFCLFTALVIFMSWCFPVHKCICNITDHCGDMTITLKNNPSAKNSTCKALCIAILSQFVRYNLQQLIFLKKGSTKLINLFLQLVSILKFESNLCIINAIITMNVIEHNTPDSAMQPTCSSATTWLLMSAKPESRLGTCRQNGVCASVQQSEHVWAM